MSAATRAQIEALPREQLEKLAEALLDFSGPADLAAWLATAIAAAPATAAARPSVP